MLVKLDAKVFLDAAYLIALAQTGDRHHAAAVQLAQQIATARTSVVTGRAVLLEVGSSLSRLRHRRDAIRLVEALEAAPFVDVVPLTEELVIAGWKLFCQRLDKEWSWADCISFTIMQQLDIQQALTTDEHFEQAGFTALLRH